METYYTCIQSLRWTDGWIDRQQTDGWTDDGQMDGWTDTYTQTYICTNTHICVYM